MYLREEKLKAVEPFIKYDKSPASVIRELGYPRRATLYAWYKNTWRMDAACHRPAPIADTPKIRSRPRSIISSGMAGASLAR